MSKSNQIWANVETGLAYPINTTSIVSDNITFKNLTSKPGVASTMTVGAGGTLATTATTFLTTSSTNLSSDGTPVLIGGGAFVGQIIGNMGLVITGDSNANNQLILRSTTNATKGYVHLDEVTPSTSVGTGSLVVDGGASVGGQLWVTGINVPSVKSGNVYSRASIGGTVTNVANFANPAIVRDSAVVIGNEVKATFVFTGDTVAGIPTHFYYTLPAEWRSTNFAAVQDANGVWTLNDFANGYATAIGGTTRIDFFGYPALTTTTQGARAEVTFTRN